MKKRKRANVAQNLALLVVICIAALTVGGFIWCNTFKVLDNTIQKSFENGEPDILDELENTVLG